MSSRVVESIEANSKAKSKVVTAIFFIY